MKDLPKKEREIALHISTFAARPADAASQLAASAARDLSCDAYVYIYIYIYVYSM